MTGAGAVATAGRSKEIRTLAVGQGALISATRWDLRRPEDMRIGARQSQLLQSG
ncbi:MAG: hypothetical protein JWN05_1382 [Arthrobacter sp.]|jgi:hypothetical protein|nr:hypothetical protein [Arthrobacter sp.]